MRAARFPERSSTGDRIAGFAAHLRANGFPLGVGQFETAMRAIGAIDATRRDEVRLALGCVFANDEDRRRRFADLFDSWWLDHGRKRELLQESRQEARRESRRTSLLERSIASSQGGGAADAPDDGESETEASGEGRLAAVRSERIRKTDLRLLSSPHELARAAAIARDLAAAMRDRRSRRRRAARRGAMLDLRRIARRSVAHGGEPFELLARRRPDRPVEISALLDVSGSMGVYSGVFLAFLKGLAAADSRTDTYVMHTRLVRVSDALKGSDGMAALGRMSLMAHGFGGGTRLGTCLATYVEQHARHRVGARTVVVILSDGYDTDPPEVIAGALARLRRRNCRIVWLNPLLGWQGYAPVARSMAAALPFLDHFAAANTLDALAALEPQLARL